MTTVLTRPQQDPSKHRAPPAPAEPAPPTVLDGRPGRGDYLGLARRIVAGEVFDTHLPAVCDAAHADRRVAAG